MGRGDGILDREAVEATLRKIAATALGNVLDFDYFRHYPFESQTLYWRYAHATIQATGEPLKFGGDSTPPSHQRLAELLENCGLGLLKPQTLGQETHGKRAWGGFAVAIVK